MTSESKRGSRRSASASATIGAVVVLAGMAFASEARAECSRATLERLAATYVEAQASGNPALLPLAAGAAYGENDVARDPAGGILAQALTVDFTRSFHDTAQCASFTELTAASQPHPYVIHTRIEANADGKVTRMESVVTDEDDWVFGADAHLAQTRVEDWGEIPAERRDRREVLQAAADAYIDNWSDPDLPVPHGTPCARLEGRIYTGSRDPQGQTERIRPLGLPLFVKPARAGSSLGITRVDDLADLPAAIAEAERHDPKVVVEAAIVGREIECGVLGGHHGERARASLPGEIVVDTGRHTFYDFEAKYLDEASVRLACPADLPDDVTRRVREIAVQAFEALGCEGLARVDVFVTPQDEVVVNEINTMPGFTPFSMYPRMWEATGLTYPELVDELVRLALERPTGLR